MPESMKSITPGEVNIVQMFDFLRQQWLAIGTTILLFLLVALAAILFITPVYRVAATLFYTGEERDSGTLTRSDSPLSGFFAGLGGQLGVSADTQQQSAIARLTSPVFIARFVTKEGLLPILFKERWNKKGKNWMKKHGGKPSTWEIAKRFKRNLSVVLDARSGLLKITLEWEHPGRAAEILTKFVAMANDTFLRAAKSLSDARLEYLKRSLNVAENIEVRRAIARLLEVEIKRSMLLSVDQEFAFRTLAAPVAPTEDAYIRPDPLLLLSMGLIFGIIGGVVIAYIRALTRINKVAERPVSVQGAGPSVI